VIIACSRSSPRSTSSASQTSSATNLFTIAKVGRSSSWRSSACSSSTPETSCGPVAPLSFVRAVLLLIFRLLGVRDLTVPAEESLQPRRDMPFALIATILTVCAIYLPIHLVAAGMLDHLASEQAPSRPWPESAGPAGRYGMTFIAATSMAGCALISLVGGTRLAYAMSSAGRSRAGSDPPRRLAHAGAPRFLIGVLRPRRHRQRLQHPAAVSAGTRCWLIWPAAAPACAGRRERRGRHGCGANGRRLRRIIPALTSLAIVTLLCALEREEIIGGLSGVGFGTVLTSA